ncbi:hypothetical protein FRC10_003269 [Ceratobasidium sp. 414]|nr:hypothetical protein FRC10_003269 [Ceratobasidium sp. 414]
MVDLLLCGPAWLESLKARQLDPESIRPQLPLGRHWRRLFTDVVLFKILDALDTQARNEKLAKSISGESTYSTEWNYLITLLDLTIILAGAPGEGRLELVHSCIAYIQHKYLPPPLSDIQSANLNAHRNVPPAEIPLLPRPVPKVEPSPTFSSFPSLAQRSFVMPGFAKDWPAIERWGSKSYLLASSGHGRVVPVERGGDYRAEDWGVDVMPWDLFLERIGWGQDDSEPTGDPERLYLAQHSLFTQFPKLQADILIPDYVYTTPSTQSPGMFEYLGFESC